MIKLKNYSNLLPKASSFLFPNFSYMKNDLQNVDFYTGDDFYFDNQQMTFDYF